MIQQEDRRYRNNRSHSLAENADRRNKLGTISVPMCSKSLLIVPTGASQVLDFPSLGTLSRQRSRTPVD
jgi:hypothetical protein